MMDRWAEHTGQGQLVWTMAMATSQDYLKPISESSVLVSATSQGCCGEYPRKVPEQHQEHSCVLNKQAALARTAHRLDEASMLSETSVPRLQNLVLMPSICVSIALRELDGLACPFHSLVGSGHL